MPANTAETDITRTIRAPLSKVWHAWADPAEVQKWWGPNGFTIPRCEWTMRPQGNIFIDMKGPDGTVYPMNGTFLEVTEPTRIVFLTRALDANGIPMFEGKNTVTFAEANGTTTITINVIVENVTPAVKMFTDGMTQGWTEQTEKLVEVVLK